jgi:hypothetical protein
MFKHCLNIFTVSFSGESDESHSDVTHSDVSEELSFRSQANSSRSIVEKEDSEVVVVEGNGDTSELPVDGSTASIEGEHNNASISHNSMDVTDDEHCKSTIQYQDDHRNSTLPKAERNSSAVIHGDESVDEVRDQMGCSNHSIVQLDEDSSRDFGSSFEAVDVACSPLKLSSTDSPMAISKDDSNKSTSLVSIGRSYEVADIGCSPIQNESLSEKGDNHPQSPVDASHHKMKNIHTEGEESDDKQHLSSSFIVDDEAGTPNSKGLSSPIRFTPKVVQELGKGYRTPPVSPVVSMLHFEGLRLARDASTPLGGQDLMQSTSQELSSSTIAKNAIPSLSTNHIDNLHKSTSQISPGNASKFNNNSHSFEKPANQTDNSDKSTNQISSPGNTSLDESANDKTASFEEATNHLDSFQKSANQASFSERKSTNVDHSFEKTTNHTLPLLSEEESRSLGISIHISEESSGSLYETRDVSCRPISNSSMQNQSVKNQSVKMNTSKSTRGKAKQNESALEDSVFAEENAKESMSYLANTSMYSSDESESIHAVSVNNLNYTNIGNSPTTTTTSSARRRSKAATFFDVSTTSDESQGREEFGASQYADTQPVDVTMYQDSPSSTHNQVSLVLGNSTEHDTSVGNSTVESDMFDLDRLKPEEGEKTCDNNEKESVVINDSFVENDEVVKPEHVTRSSMLIGEELKDDDSLTQSFNHVPSKVIEMNGEGNIYSRFLFYF